MNFKNLFLQKIDGKIMGCVKINLRNFNDLDYCLKLERFIHNNEVKTVSKVQGFLVVNEYSQKDFKRLFDYDIPLNQLVNISVDFWGERLANSNYLQEGNIYMFMTKDVALNTYQKKNGQTGYQLKVTAFDFDYVHYTK